MISRTLVSNPLNRRPLKTGLTLLFLEIIIVTNKNYYFIVDVLDLAWSPDDSFLASGSVDNTITIWNGQRFPGLYSLLNNSSPWPL